MNHMNSMQTKSLTGGHSQVAPKMGYFIKTLDTQIRAQCALTQKCLGTLH